MKRRATVCHLFNSNIIACIGFVIDEFLCLYIQKKKTLILPYYYYYSFRLGRISV